MDGVITSFAIKKVIAISTQDGVIAIIAPNGVIPGAAVDIVIA